MPKAILVAGLGWGDEGKGAAVDYLCRKHDAKFVIRYNGGAQAAHTVVSSDTKHTFAQFGSGTLIPGVKTHLSRFMMVNPITMMNEEDCLREIGVTDAFGRTTVDSRCLIITPFDKMLNRITERIRGKNAHGSCGMGIGETRLYHNTYGDEALFAGDLGDTEKTKLKLRIRQLRAADTVKMLGVMDAQLLKPGMINTITDEYFSWYNRMYISPKFKGIFWWNSDSKPVIFEGAQGVLLDEREEFLPHNTWSDCTFKNADTLLEEAEFKGEVTRVGCIRAYMTRHGAGPLPTEDAKLDVLPEPHNFDTGFQGKFRRGHFDMASVKHALDICGGVDEIHMSHLDQLPLIYPGVNVDAYVSNIERLLETPITVLGYGPKAEDRRERVKSFTARRRSTQNESRISCSTTGETREGQSI